MLNLIKAAGSVIGATFLMACALLAIIPAVLFLGIMLLILAAAAACVWLAVHIAIALF